MSELLIASMEQDVRLSLRFNPLCVVFCPRRGKKRHTIKTKYHAAAGKSVVSESPVEIET